MFCRLVSIVFALKILSECSGYEFSKEETEVFGNLTMNDLPRMLQFQLQKSKRLGDKSSWCCKSGRNLVTTVQKTRVKMSIVKVAKQFNSGSKGCGFGGWKRCTTYALRYVEKPSYHVETFEVVQQLDCPEKDLVCCVQHILVAGSCVALNSLTPEVIQNLKKLKEAGALPVG